MRMTFTKRQQEILPLLLAGKTDKEIGLELGLKRSTVAGHIYRAMQTTGAATRAQLAAQLMQESRQFPLYPMCDLSTCPVCKRESTVVQACEKCGHRWEPV